MLACRGLLRCASFSNLVLGYLGSEGGPPNWTFLPHDDSGNEIDRVLNFTREFSISYPVYFQGNCSFNSLSHGSKYNLRAMSGNKKWKTVNPVWRPVSTQTNSVEDSAVRGMIIEHEGGKEAEEVHSSVAGDISVAQSVTEVDEAGNKVTDGVSISCDVGEQGPLKGNLEVSTEKHSLSLEVGATVMKFVWGKEGSTQKLIEEEFQVKINFPSSQKEDSIIIEGNSADDVAKASEKIQRIIDEAIRSPSFTYSHFVSLPLAIHPELVDKLVSFQNSILGNDSVTGDCSRDDPNEGSSKNEEDDQKLDNESKVAVEMKVTEESSRVAVDLKGIPLITYQPKATPTPSLLDLGIERSIFIKPKTFHLTVLMLKLWNKERVNAASEVLKSVVPKVIEALDNRPVFVRLKGLDCMKGSLARARVLYVPVEEAGNEGRLLRACKVITDAFVEAGLILEKDAKQSLKLHATLMNTSHRKRKKRSWKFDSFDARGIYKQYGTEDWGEYLIREAHLSQRFVYDENGYYHCCASIPFPENMEAD